MVCFILTVYLADEGHGSIWSNFIQSQSRSAVADYNVCWEKAKTRTIFDMVIESNDSLDCVRNPTLLSQPHCFVQFQGNCFGLPLDKLTYSYSYLSSQGHMLVLCYLAGAQWWNWSKMNCWWRAKYYFLFKNTLIHFSVQSQICPLCLHIFCNYFLCFFCVFTLPVIQTKMN